MLVNEPLLMSLGSQIADELKNIPLSTDTASATAQNALTWKKIMNLVMTYIVSNSQVNVQIPIMPAVTPSGPGSAGPGTGIGTIV